MSFETISLLLNWMELGALLAILFRLSYTFNLIASTQRQLRRSIYHLAERRVVTLAAQSYQSRPTRAARHKTPLVPYIDVGSSGAVSRVLLPFPAAACGLSG